MAESIADLRPFVREWVRGSVMGWLRQSVVGWPNLISCLGIGLCSSRPGHDLRQSQPGWNRRLRAFAAVSPEGPRGRGSLGHRRAAEVQPAGDRALVD